MLDRVGKAVLGMIGGLIFGVVTAVYLIELIDGIGWTVLPPLVLVGIVAGVIWSRKLFQFLLPFMLFAVNSGDPEGPVGAEGLAVGGPLMVLYALSVVVGVGAAIIPFGASAMVVTVAAALHALYSLVVALRG
ncbi:MAG: hypothetical protein AAGD35_19495 [Actinomycetota bacterium]